MELETRSLLVAAERARVLDHNGNRGSDAEHAIREWLRRRVEPEYTVSSGEIIDAFDTDADLKSRQQDIVVHLNSRGSNRLVLPSGLRLIPIETVAAVVEVKLALDKPELFKADKAAAQTANLRLSVQRRIIRDPLHSGFADYASVTAFNRDVAPNGVRLWDPELRNRTTFAVFGFKGPSSWQTMAEWMQEAITVSLVACLESGCVFRRPQSRGIREKGESHSLVYTSDAALMAFAWLIDVAIDKHRSSSEVFSGVLDKYNEVRGEVVEDGADCG